MSPRVYVHTVECPYCGGRGWYSAPDHAPDCTPERCSGSCPTEHQVECPTCLGGGAVSAAQADAPMSFKVGDQARILVGINRGRVCAIVAVDTNGYRLRVDKHDLFYSERELEPA